MKIEDAIEYLQSCKDTHVDVVEYYDKGGTPEQWWGEYSSDESLGTKGFHQECVDKYDEIIELLESS